MCATTCVDHPSFPHESTANQFFSESQFESYRELGEHIARNVFGDAATETPSPSSTPPRSFPGSAADGPRPRPTSTRIFSSR